MRMHLTPGSLAIAARRLCRQHLLGDHGELHKHRHVFERRYSIAGRRGQIEPLLMQAWHDALVREMARRGYRHQSPYAQPSLAHLPAEDLFGKVDREATLDRLRTKCTACAQRIQETEPFYQVELFNEIHPAGTIVRYRSYEGAPWRLAYTRSEAEVLGGHTAVVWLEGVVGAWMLEHVEVVQ